MNFRIVENADKGYDEQDVIKDYLNHDIPVREIKEKYGISDGSWVTLLKHWKKDGIPIRSGRNRDNPRYYIFDKRYGRWSVVRTIHSRTHNFGRYDTEEEAQNRVKELKENNWNGLLTKGEN